MAGEKPTIDELKNMSDEDILKLDATTLAAAEVKDGEGGKSGDDGAAGGSGDGAGDGAGAGGDDHGLTPEQLETLARGEDVVDAAGKPKFVPHARFNEVNEEKKTAVGEAQTLREQLAAVNAQLELVKKGGKLPTEEAPVDAAAAKAADDAKAADEKYRTERRALLKSQQEAILEGDVEKAAAVAEQLEEQAEARSQERLEATIKRTREETRAEVEQTLTVSQMQTRAENAAKTVFEAYPFLDNKSEKPDVDAINLVVMKRDKLISEGKDPVEAMLTAAKEVGERFKVLHVAAPAAGGAPAADAAKTLQEKKDAENAAAVAKGVGINEKQPKTAGVGAGERAHNDGEEVTFEQFKNMTDEQIAKLPDHVIRKLDGSNRKA